MPFVTGFLRLRKRHHPGHPDIGLPDPERPVDPDYGIEEGGTPEFPIVDPPPGVWPPLTPENPWRPVDPGFGQGRPLPPTVGGGPARPPVAPGRPDQGLPGGGGGEGERPEVQPPIYLPPGMIWPPLPPGVHGKYLALVLIAGAKGVAYHYTVIDADLRPDQGLPGGGGRPDQGLPPEAQPKR